MYVQEQVLYICRGRTDSIPDLINKRSHADKQSKARNQLEEIKVVSPPAFLVNCFISSY